MPHRSDPPKPVTIRTIAERAGVHPSTVSRVLRQSGEPRSASAQRIHAIAGELGYRPNLAAATLRTGESQALGVLVPYVTDVVMATLYEAIDHTALQFGYQAILAGTGDRFEEQIRRADVMLSRVDGLVVADAHLDQRYVSWLEDRQVPFVLAMRHAGREPAVVADDQLGGRLVAAHLADLGHRNIAILAGMPWSSATIERTSGCVEGLRERRIAVRGDLIEPCELDPASGRAAMERVLERSSDVTAVWAVNDSTALGASIALRERGLRPGLDVAVVGYNDIPIAAAFGLTTVRSPLKEMGSIATRMLFECMAGRPFDTVRLSTELIVRGSSCPARAPRGD